MTHNFPLLKNDRILKAMRFEPVDATPVWMMRQAGRYLPEYKQTRAQAGDFLSLCKNTALATEVTIQPFRRFDLDAAILFSDILTIPDALGLGLYFEAGEGPKFRHTIRSMADVQALPKVDMATELDYVMKAVTSIRHELGGRAPLFGFSGSPWTLATYMVEGGSSKEFRHIKAMLYSEPATLHALLARLQNAVVDYLAAQIEAGAQMLQIFDSWGGALGHRQFIEFSHHYNTAIIHALKQRYPAVPVVLFTKGGGLWLGRMADMDCDALGVDWTVSLRTARQVLQGHDKSLQGNIDPNVLFAPAPAIEAQVRAVLDDFGAPHIAQPGAERGCGHIFNLGHGISQYTPPEAVKALVDEVHRYSKLQRQAAA